MERDGERWGEGEGGVRGSAEWKGGRAGGEKEYDRESPTAAPCCARTLADP